MWFPNRSDTNQAAQSQKQARSLKFWIQEEAGLYYPCYHEADLRLCFHVFTYADCWFSHEVAQIMSPTLSLYNIRAKRKMRVI